MTSHRLNTIGGWCVLIAIPAFIAMVRVESMVLGGIALGLGLVGVTCLGIAAWADQMRAEIERRDTRDHHDGDFPRRAA